MHGYWSLVIFTLLGQAAAGMLILSFFSRTADTSAGQGVGRLHPARRGRAGFTGTSFRPTVSFYTITNVGTSWLSREILFVGLFGAGLLLWLITLNAWARRLAAHPRPCFCLCHEPGLHHPDRSFLEFAVHLLALSRHQPAARFQPAALHGRPCRPKGSRKEGSAPARLAIPYSSYWPSYSKCW